MAHETLFVPKQSDEVLINCFRKIAEEPLHHRIIPAIALPAHAAYHTVAGQLVLVSLAPSHQTPGPTHSAPPARCADCLSLP